MTLLDTEEQEAIVKELQEQSKQQARVWRGAFACVSLSAACGVLFVAVQSEQDLIEEIADSHSMSPDFLFLVYLCLVLSMIASAFYVFTSIGRWRSLVLAISALVFTPLLLLSAGLSAPPHLQHRYQQVNLLCLLCWAAGMFVDSEFNAQSIDRELTELSNLKYKYKKV